MGLFAKICCIRGLGEQVQDVAEANQPIFGYLMQRLAIDIFNNADWLRRADAGRFLSNTVFTVSAQIVSTVVLG